MKTFLLLLFLTSAILCWAEPAEQNVRIVSLSPNMTESIFALGKAESLVGRSNACNYPNAAKQIPIAGHFGRPNIERVLTLKPDYIISSALADKNMVKRFKQFNIKVLFLPAKSFEDYFKNLRILGKILHCPAKAERICRQTKEKLDKFKKLANKIPEAKKKRVLFVIWDMPLMTIGSDSFITDMIRFAGGVSVTAKYHKAYFTCSLEWILANPPDILVFPKIPPQRVKELIKHPGWKDLEAVQQNRLFYNINPDLLCRMGPRTIEGIRQLHKIFYPGKK